MVTNYYVELIEQLGAGGFWNTIPGISVLSL